MTKVILILKKSRKNEFKSTQIIIRYTEAILMEACAFKEYFDEVFIPALLQCRKVHSYLLQYHTAIC